MIDPSQSIRPYCQLCHKLIRGVAYLTFGARTPGTLSHHEDAPGWELFVTWIGCADCTEELQACSRNEVLLRTYHLRKPENPTDIRSLNYYRYQFSHFCIPVGSRDLHLTPEKWMKCEGVLSAN